jgi:hypothetical protein
MSIHETSSLTSRHRSDVYPLASLGQKFVPVGILADGIEMQQQDLGWEITRFDRAVDETGRIAAQVLAKKILE